MISGIDYGKGNDESCTVTFVSPEYIKNLEEENNQLKDYSKDILNKFAKKDRVLKELRSWLEEEINNIETLFGGETSMTIGYKTVLSKLNELEGGKNE